MGDYYMNKYSGSNFDDLLEEEGILEGVSARAHKRLLALQIEELMKETSISKTQLAEKLNTSRSQVDRLLDPSNTTITLESLERLARAFDKQLKVELA